MDLSNDNVIHKVGEKVEYLQFKRLLEYPNIVHAFTLSRNGFDIAGNDTFESKKEIVLSNYKNLADELKFNYDGIIRPYQTHTNVVEPVLEVESNNISIFDEKYKDVDGLLTKNEDIVFSLSFADCMPIYIYDPVRKVVGLIHSGWQGTLKRIIQKAMHVMKRKYYSKEEDLICCIGPTIRKCHFEVDEDVANKYKEEFGNMKNIDEMILCTNEKLKKYVIDTVKINTVMMLGMGVKEENIIDSGICTVCNKEYMHSYRAHGKNAGRNTAIIGIKK